MCICAEMYTSLCSVLLGVVHGLDKLLLSSSLFFADPQFSYEFPMEYLERVKKMHETGGFGSIG